MSGSDIVSGGGAGLDGGDVSGANVLGGGDGSVARTGCGGLGPVADDLAVASTEAVFPRATATETLSGSDIVSGGGAGLDGGDVSGANVLGGGDGVGRRPYLAQLVPAWPAPAVAALVRSRMIWQ